MWPFSKERDDDPLKGVSADPVARRAASAHPFERGAVIGCWLAGLAVVAGLAHPTTIFTTIPEGFAWLWGLLMLTGASLVLVAPLLSDRLNSLMVEKIGLAAISVVAFTYTVILLSLVTQEGLFAALVCFGVGLGSLLRWLDARREIQAVARHLGGMT